jgi:ParB-like chromosome segregation protein Spo0J
MNNIQWRNEKRKLSQLIPYEKNPRILSTEEKERLKKSLTKFDLAEIPAIDTDNKIVAGHQRIMILKEIKGPEHEIDVRIPNRKLTQEEFDEYLIRSNKNSGEWDFQKLATEFEMDDLLEWGFEANDFKMPEVEDLDMEPSEDNEVKIKHCPHCGKDLA